VWGEKRKIIVVGREAKWSDRGGNRDKRRNAQTEETVAYRVLLSVNKYYGKTEEKKKDSSQCYVCYWFSRMFPQIVLCLNINFHVRLLQSWQLLGSVLHSSSC